MSGRSSKYYGKEFKEYADDRARQDESLRAEKDRYRTLMRHLDERIKVLLPFYYTCENGNIIHVFKEYSNRDFRKGKRYIKKLNKAIKKCEKELEEKFEVYEALEREQISGALEKDKHDKKMTHLESEIKRVNSKLEEKCKLQLDRDDHHRGVYWNIREVDRALFDSILSNFQFKQKGIEEKKLLQKKNNIWIFKDDVDDALRENIFDCLKKAVDRRPGIWKLGKTDMVWVKARLLEPDWYIYYYYKFWIYNIFLQPDIEWMFEDIKKDGNPEAEKKERDRQIKEMEKIVKKYDKNINDNYKYDWEKELLEVMKDKNNSRASDDTLDDNG